MARVAILGAGGRMGRALVRLVAEGGDHRLVAALGEPGDPLLGRDAGELAGAGLLGVALTADLDQVLRAGAEVVIDFTAPAAAARHAAACAAAGQALVVGTTGLDAAALAALAAASARVAVLHARNMSLGITVLTELVRQATALLGSDFDVEITEAHHRHKKDAPSGTALQLGEAAAAARGRHLDEVAVYQRPRLDPAARPAGAIGFAAIRAGAIVGDHTVLLAGAEEQLELTHRATDRALFARGALRAAGWLAGKPPGLYSLREVLGLPA